MVNPRLYFIKDKHRKNIIIDTKVIDGEQIRSIDEYFLKFPTTKKLVYEYMKASKEPTELSYIHKLFINQSVVGWRNSPMIKADTTASYVIKKIVYDDYSWGYGVRDIQNTLFDSKYLLITDKRQIAKKCIDIFVKAQATHRISHHTSLRNFDTVAKHNEFFTKRMEITKKYFEGVVLNDVKLPSTIRVNYMYDFIELFDEVSKMTFVHTVREDMDNTIEMLFEHGRGIKKKSTTNVRVIMSFIRKTSGVLKMVDNIDENPNALLAYHEELHQHKLKYKNTYNQCVATIEHVLYEHETKSNYVNGDHLGIIFVHVNTVESTWLRFHKTNKTMSLFKTSYYASDDGSVDTNDWLRITQRSQSYKRNEKNIVTAKLLMDLGFMNIFRYTKEPKMTEYCLLARGKMTNRYMMSFMTTTPTQANEILRPYLNINTEVINDFNFMIKSKDRFRHILPKDKDLNKEKIYSGVEYEYKKLIPAKFKNTRDVMVNELNESITLFLNNNKKLLYKNQ